MQSARLAVAAAAARAIATEDQHPAALSAPLGADGQGALRQARAKLDAEHLTAVRMQAVTPRPAA